MPEAIIAAVKTPPTPALCKKEYKKLFNPPPHFLPFNRHFRSRDRVEEEFSFL
jgi:hypothetical protein